MPGGDLTGLLLAHIPADIAPTCTADPQRLWEGELVTLVCAPPDADVEVTYSGFDTADHMGAAYQSSLDTIDLSILADALRRGHLDGYLPARGAGCRPGDLLVGAQRPRRSCGPTTDLSILSVAVSPSLDAASLYQWWMEAGPDL